MIAYGVCIGSEDKFQRFAAPGLSKHGGDGAPIAESRDNTSIHLAYNEILDAFADRDDLEALVLLHEDVEIRDERFIEKVLSALSRPDVAVVGVVGARGVTSLEWWEGQGVGHCDETRGPLAYPELEGDVDSVDGLMLILSPWAVGNLRFDAERYAGFHAYDADICFAARAAGKRVVVADIDVFHHTKGGYGDEAVFRANDVLFREKWFGRPGGRLSPPSARTSTEERAGKGVAQTAAPDRATPVTVVLPVTEGIEATLLCLEAVERAQHLNATPFDLVVVDGATRDGTAELLDRLEGDVTVIHTPSPSSWGELVDLAAQTSTSEHLVLLDQNAQVEGAWLDALSAAAARVPGCAAVLPNAARACLLVRRSAFEAVGGVDGGRRSHTQHLVHLIDALVASDAIVVEADAVSVARHAGTGSWGAAADVPADRLREGTASAGSVPAPREGGRPPRAVAEGETPRVLVWSSGPGDADAWLADAARLMPEVCFLLLGADSLGATSATAVPNVSLFAACDPERVHALATWAHLALRAPGGPGSAAVVSAATSLGLPVVDVGTTSGNTEAAVDVMALVGKLRVLLARSTPDARALPR